MKKNSDLKRTEKSSVRKPAVTRNKVGKNTPAKVAAPKRKVGKADRVIKLNQNKPKISIVASASTSRRMSVLDMHHTDAQTFFLKSESYCNFDLPSYVSFQEILDAFSRELDGKPLSSQWQRKPDDYDDINHVILNNKDGKYAWRPMELIHPALYVSLVKTITTKDNWNTILAAFKGFASNPLIECISIPVQSKTKQKDKAEQILQWWEDLEQRSLELSLDYEYLLQTDITDCYGAIYTHSIPWALHTKAVAKKKENRENAKLVGCAIDKHIRHFSYSQTNGIPQGSVLMDFIAEMVLGYADCELTNRIKHLGIEDYKILRYRDDYRIFVNNPQHGDAIIKALTEIMFDLGMKLNSSKTKSSHQVVTDSLKPDKRDWISSKNYDSNIQKHLMLIHEFSAKHPNSGSLIRALNEFYGRIVNRKKVAGNLMPQIGILTDIAYHSPKAYPICMAILSKYTDLVGQKDQKAVLINRLNKKFGKLPNTGYLQIWLQRISITFLPDYEYGESLCNVIMGKDKNSVLWNVDWLNNKLSRKINTISIVDKNALKKAKTVIPKSEAQLFNLDIFS